MSFIKSLLTISFLFLPFFSVSQDIKIYSEKFSKGFILMADNYEYVPVSANFDFTLENVRLSGSNVVILKPNEAQQIIGKLYIIDRTKPGKFSYKYSYNFGNTFQEDFDEDYEYTLPYSQDSTYVVMQGYNGNFSHEGQEALDFMMPVGTPVMAAREGIVVKVVENFDKGCPGRECMEFNNIIMIQHPDGTFADYAHLMLNGVTVEKGERIAKGQLIGYSGNTGFSSAPHLHFAVYLQKIFARKTVPTLFKVNATTAPQILEHRKSYKNAVIPRL